MNLITNLTALRLAMQTFCTSYGANLPSAALLAVQSAASAVSSVTAVVDVGEALYAYRSAITDAPTLAAARTLAGQCANFAAMNNWHGLADSGRGSGIYQAMCRELGEAAPTGMTWPAPSADPAPAARFAGPPVTIIPTPPPAS